MHNICDTARKNDHLEIKLALEGVRKLTRIVQRLKYQPYGSLELWPRYLEGSSWSWEPWIEYMPKHVRIEVSILELRWFVNTVIPIRKKYWTFHPTDAYSAKFWTRGAIWAIERVLSVESSERNASKWWNCCLQPFQNAKRKKRQYQRETLKWGRERTNRGGSVGEFHEHR